MRGAYYELRSLKYDELLLPITTAKINCLLINLQISFTLLYVDQETDINTAFCFELSFIYVKTVDWTLAIGRKCIVKLLPAFQMANFTLVVYYFIVDKDCRR